MKGDYSGPWTKQKNENNTPPSCCYAIQHTTRRQQQCIQTQTVVVVVPKQKPTPLKHSSKLALPPCHNHTNTFSFVPMLLVLLFLVASSLFTPALSHPIVSDSGRRLSPANQTFRPGSELNKLRVVQSYLKKINKPAVKTIQAFSFCL